MLFSLEVLPAREGDCLILHWDDQGAMAVIDGGPGTTFRKVLRPRLDEIRKQRGLDTLSLELVMVSHVDNDHIVGICALFAELRTAKDKPKPPLWADRLWHNAFTDILGDDFNAYLTPATATAALAAANPEADEATVAAALEAAGLDKDIEVNEAVHLASVLAGQAEGRDLRNDYKLLFDANRIHCLNTPFKKDGEPSVVMRSAQAVDPIAGLQIQVIGPSEAELIRLKQDYDRYLKENGLAVPAALVAAAGDQDRSPTNLSSLVCLVSFGPDPNPRRMLLTGDAHGDSILQGLKEIGELAEGGVLELDVLKVQHHGSMRNASPDFFKAIRAQTYVISADGKHSNPDRETLEWLVASRQPQDAYHLVFTYPLADIDVRRRKIHEDEQARKKKKDPAHDVVAWNPKDHAVEDFVNACKAQGHAFTVSIGRTIIDVGDEKVPASLLPA